MLFCFYCSFIIILIDYKTFSAAVLLYRPDEEFIWKFLYTFPIGLAIIKSTNILHVLRSISPISMRVSILKLPFIHEICRDEYSVAFCPRKSGNIIPNWAVVNNTVGIDNKCFAWINIMIINVSTDNNGGSCNVCIFDIEEAFANGSIPCNITKQIKVVFEWFIPFQIVILPAIDYIVFWFLMLEGVLIFLKSYSCYALISTCLFIRQKVAIIGSNSPISLLPSI